MSAPPLRDAHDAMVTITALAAEVFDDHYWRHRPAYDLGQLHGDSYWRAFAESTGVTLTDAQITELIRLDVSMWTATDPIMIDWARRLRESGLLVAILSNMGREIRHYMDRNFAWLETFQQHIWSYELGISKPDAAIYTHTLEQLGVSADQALFIDDIAENVRAAQAAGLYGVIFTTPARLQTDLQRLGFAEQLPPVISER